MLTVAQVLAENNFGDTRSGGLAGPMGMFLIVLLAIVTVFLIRNMNGRLRRLPDRFPGQSTEADSDRTEVKVVDPTLGVTSGSASLKDSYGSAPKAPTSHGNPVHGHDSR